MINPETVSVLLQFGFAGVLLAFLYLVNRQYIKLVEVLGSHLNDIISLLDKCMEGKRDIIG